MIGVESDELADQAHGEGEQQPQHDEEGSSHNHDAERDQDDLRPRPGACRRFLEDLRWVRLVELVGTDVPCLPADGTLAAPSGNRPKWL